MAPTDKICTKTEEAAVTNLSDTSKDSVAAQETKLVYAIYQSYKHTGLSFSKTWMENKNHTVALIIRIAN